jgi:hypothetical protein
MAPYLIRMRWILLFAVSFAPTGLIAQETAYKYGDVGEHDFIVAPVAGLESANAFIIYDYGEFYIDDRLNSIFTRHKRFRVLNEAGLDYGNITIRYISHRNLQEVRQLKAQVFSKDENGRIQRRSLRSRDFHKESINSTFSVVKFTIPDLQPGSVVEFSYQINSLEPVYIPSWTFQSAEPTLYSEISAFIPNALRYDPVYTGYVRLEPPNQTEYFERDRPGILHTVEGGTRFRYIATDVPPMNEEAFTANIDNYRATIRFNLSRVQFYGQKAQTASNTWPALGKRLMEDSEIGGRLRSSRELTRLAQTLTADLTDSLAIAKAIYNHVTSEYSWDERHSYWSSRRSDDVIGEKRGNSGELAFLLINLLREAGFDAHPVLISTRDNGILLPVYPIQSQFNHVITRLSIGGDHVFLDVVSPILPFGLLNVESVNERGFLLMDGTYELIPIKAPDSYRNRSMITLTLSEDGSGSGMVQASASGYQALSLRESIQREDDPAYYSTLLNSVKNLSIDTSYTTGLDDRHSPVVLNATFHSSTMAETAGDLLLLNPILIHRWAENPFKSPSRLYPIDFPYPYESTLVVNITLPEGFVVESLPESQRFSMGPDAAFSIIYAQNEAGIQAMCTYRIQKTQFLPDQYAALQAFFNRMVDAQQQQIVLKKS